MDSGDAETISTWTQRGESFGVARLDAIVEFVAEVGGEALCQLVSRDALAPCGGVLKVFGETEDDVEVASGTLLYARPLDLDGHLRSRRQ